MSLTTRGSECKVSGRDIRELNPASRWWDWSENENERILRIDGIIAEESWIDDDVTPKQFQSELMSGDGNVSLGINFAVVILGYVSEVPKISVPRSSQSESSFASFLGSFLLVYSISSKLFSKSS